MRTHLVTGGAGFIGSSLAIRLKRQHAGVRVVAFDNLRRRGAEANLSRLSAEGVEFQHGDVRNPEDLAEVGRVDCVLECAAEPSALAGHDGSPEYVVRANLVGTLNCLEIARRHGADFIFLSTSRVYPYEAIESLRFVETCTRFDLAATQLTAGASEEGLSEEFPLAGRRSLYGATKLASELIVQEYLGMYGLRGVINRCGVVAGPWQMGKTDQGFVVHWAARHLFGGPLAYVGFGGCGKQVRDVLHVDDLGHLLDLQLARLDELSGEVFNVGGGRRGAISLLELTALCESLTGRRLDIGPVEETRPADVRLYVSDCGKVLVRTGWAPRITPPEILADVVRWLVANRDVLQPLLGPGHSPVHLLETSERVAPGSPLTDSYVTSRSTP